MRVKNNGIYLINDDSEVRWMYAGYGDDGVYSWLVYANYDRKLLFMTDKSTNSYSLWIMKN